MLKGFDEFERKECVRINLKVAIFFVVTLIATIIIDVIVFKISQPYMQKLDNMFADLIAILMFIFFTLFILIIYNAVVFIKSKIYREYLNNIKAFLGIILCNLFITAFLYITTKTILPWMYIGTVVLIDSAIFCVRYGTMKYEESKIEKSIEK